MLALDIEIDFGGKSGVVFFLRSSGGPSCIRVNGNCLGRVGAFRGLIEEGGQLIGSSRSILADIFKAAFAFGVGGCVYADEVTLCQPHEEIYFSCSLGEKMVSLCASGNVSPDNGYVQYRYGKPDHIDLQFPNKPHPPRGYFGISDISIGSANFVHVKFRSGRYDYVIYQGSPSGVYVKKNGDLVSNHACKHGDYPLLSRRAFRGITTVPVVDDLDN
ncbi:hypothetical protein BamMEX5DRAFT_0560 [Burkholderia ambifaria MEX-5]|uniref:Uncharacterized protein n=1 Tax=Burkholderia ambifaria MEX-5 TaxID=396597 RepID=B1SYE4_9BURK|nr:hypothetical protein BamMEX5DRAFT_0560 [Burkholderia ambifaria MEX-5]